MSPFRTIVEIRRLKPLMQVLYRLTGIPIRIEDSKGSLLLKTCWEDPCTSFYRINLLTSKHCNESYQYLMKHLFDDACVQYRCKNGLWDVALPIFIDNSHAATMFLGPFSRKEDRPDLMHFVVQACDYGFEFHKFLDAIYKVKTFSRNQLRNLVDCHLEFINLVCNGKEHTA